ncbi:MAG: glycosyltransferase family 2 protein, partial [archaeon]
KKENGGVASATNFAIKRTKTDLIAPLDADSFVTKEALKNMIGYFKDLKVFVVVPALVVYEPKGFIQNLQRVEYTLSVYLRKVFGLINSLTITPGPFSIFRRSFFEKHGYYDENNISQDMDIALRIQKQGYKIENSVNAVVYTVVPKTFKSLLYQRMRWYFGFITNMSRNKELFRPKFGYLGLLVLPSAFLAAFFSIVFFFIFYLQGGHCFWHKTDSTIKCFRH